MTCEILAANAGNMPQPSSRKENAGVYDAVLTRQTEIKQRERELKQVGLF